MKTFDERVQELHDLLEPLQGFDHYQDRDALLDGLQEITDSDLGACVQAIEQVLSLNGTIHTVAPVANPRGSSCIWDPKTTGERSDLKVLAKVPTVHSYAAPSFFKPTVSECYAQIPEDLLSQVVAFEIDSFGFTPYGNDAHMGVMTLYTKA